MGGKGEDNGGSGREGRRKWRLEEVWEDKRETERETRDVEGKEREIEGREGLREGEKGR